MHFPHSTSTLISDTRPKNQSSHHTMTLKIKICPDEIDSGSNMSQSTKYNGIDKHIVDFKYEIHKYYRFWVQKERGVDARYIGFPKCHYAEEYRESITKIKMSLLQNVYLSASRTKIEAILPKKFVEKKYVFFIFLVQWKTLCTSSNKFCIYIFNITDKWTTGDESSILPLRVCHS